jgi:hypothetical protein
VSRAAERGSQTGARRAPPHSLTSLLSTHSATANQDYSSFNALTLGQCPYKPCLRVSGPFSPPQLFTCTPSSPTQSGQCPFTPPSLKHLSAHCHGCAHSPTTASVARFWPYRPHAPQAACRMDCAVGQLVRRLDTAPACHMARPVTAPHTPRHS